MQSGALSTRGSIYDKIFDILLMVVMVFVLIITIYPFLNVLAISFNDSSDTVRGGIYIWPRAFTLENYRTIFNFSTLMTGFVNSTLRTVIGTLAGVASGAMVAYVLSCREFQARRLFSLMFVITMYISGGIIPTYMLMRDIGMFNNFWVYIIPGIVNVFNIFIVRSYIDGLPYALQESAKIEGANDLVIFLHIIVPLCKPVLATIALFVAVGHWNSWFDTYLYNGSKKSLTTLQYELMKIIQSTQSGNNVRNSNAEEIMSRVSPDSVKMAITIVATVPILVVYPFLQKYFVKGVTLGAVKS
ncbi:putative aldouronate transport system permease protein [Anaerobacterium chartisolvens]|uniref:Putative aldouronate transport system permease protein n=1 Tax=Anaerobacterium chartisolvens TaxID=1297424 RepID=A0A369BFK8_9FIRM|nr:carbohydrate ABC transporter permease [Anaerobacterium chartisolvens]RCX19398.1 putative aldouronate transport system permease protein [Anaerobacterium chartisolvens]